MKMFGSMKNKDGILEIGGIDSRKLLAQYGSPLYVMDLELIEKNIKIFKENFKSKKFETFVVYASKAFLCKGMCNIISKFNIEMDAVSGGELYLIKSSNMPMERVHMHGNNKSVEELEMCLDYEVGSIILDGTEEVEKLSRLCSEKNKKIKVMLRINIGIDAHTHEYIKTAKHTSKFGVSIFSTDFLDLVKRIVEDKNFIFLGFHCHIGSQIFDTKAFLEEIDILVKETKSISQKLGIEIPEINLGGGFGVFYTNEDKPLELEHFMKEIIRHIEKISEEENYMIKKISIEPGRSIVANAGTTLYTVGGTKETYGGIKYVFVDGGMTDNIRPALYQAKYEALVANKMNSRNMETVTIAGKCCESGDVLIKNIKLPKCDSGDIIGILSTGAYGYSMSNNYNKICRPAVVFVKNGVSYLAIRRETYKDLVALDENIF